MEVLNEFQDLIDEGIVTSTKQVMFTFATRNFHWQGDTHQPEQQHADSYSDCREDDDIMVLTEKDVPGASLNGKQPHEMNKQQLKRWLACHGAPVTGKKTRPCRKVKYCTVATYNSTSIKFYVKHTEFIFT